MVHDAFPDKHLLYTEGGMGGSWSSANRLAKNMIMDLNNWTDGWVFWNLLLNQNGGPRHAGGEHGTNIITADTATGKLTFNPPHFVFGQFSRFIKPESKRIACTSSNDDLVATAFINTDGKIASVIHNLGSSEMIFQVWIEGKALKYRIPARGTITMVL